MLASSVGLKTHIWNNNFRSILLLTLYPLVLLAMLWGAGAVIGGMGAHPDPVSFGNAVVLEYWPLVTAIVAIWFAVAAVCGWLALRWWAGQGPFGL